MRAHGWLALLVVPAFSATALAVSQTDSSDMEQAGRRITVALPAAVTTTSKAPTTTPLRLNAAATVFAPAVRVDPPGPAPTFAPLTVEEMIRAVWPDNLEARAIRIAWRESNYQPRVHTFCCYGIFQIHKVHLGWLDEHGVYTIEQLYDPWTNVNAAYLLYLRDGWTPWTCCI